MSAPFLILDFDSTFVTVEALELLGEIVLEADPGREAKLAEVTALTEQAMNGDIGFSQALARRIEILKPRREHVEALVERLRKKVTPSIQLNRDFIQRAGERLFIVTGGFHEYVDPVVAEFGVPAERVLANRLVFGADGAADGVDASLALSRDGGKVEAVRALGLEGEVVVVGDGWTDYEIRAAGVADRFYAFVETTARPKVTAAADAVAASFDEVLHAEKLEGRWSYPRSRMRVLLLENIHPDAVARFREEGYQVETVKGALGEDELRERLKGVHVLGLRSKTRLSRSALESADRLLAVGAFCIGTNQIDLPACTDKGVAVFNAPFSNTRSVVEMAIGEIVALTRRLFDKSAAAHQGIWDKSASGAHELRGRTLGVIGYGAIGSQLSVLAESMGMRVVYYDVGEKLALGNARRCRVLNELLEISDVVSLHVDGRPENRNLIGPEEIARMRNGAILLNLSRGHVVDVQALSDALRSGKLGGAGVDVFPEEPSGNDQPFESVLKGAPNLILTPHIGGSTEEAQAAIGEFAGERLLGFLHRGDTTFSVNLPNVQQSEVRGAHRLLHIHRNQPGVLAGINRVVAEHGLNILAQSLKTREEAGYVITDVDQGYDRGALVALRAIPGTLKVRLVY